MLNRATQWIHQHHLNGNAIPITHRQKRPYPEVTGYYIPTLLSIGEVGLAEQFARWLVSVQNPDGSFSLDNPRISYVFDTGQVIRGWVSILDRLPELAMPLSRACDWIINNAHPETGRLSYPAPGGDWSLGDRGEVSEGIHLYVLKPLRDAARLLNKPYIEEKANKALNYYLQHVPLTDFTSPNALTHFYAYIQEALVELNCVEEAKKGMAAVAKFQQANGAVPGYHDVHWVCSTGLAQLARVWYLLNDYEHADKAMAFLTQIQNQSGGFYGSYGIGATYFPADEISWAAKYCIDAENTRIAKHFDKTIHDYTPITLNDERVQVVLAALNEGKRALDAGCGKGRYAALMKLYFPSTEVHAVDVSQEMLRHVPTNIITKQASIQDLPYDNNMFDLVYCVEALEHAPNPKAALREMVRVLAPSGRLVIIDKNKAHLGALQIESWEQWFDIDETVALLKQLNLQVHAELIGYDDKKADGLFVAWIAVKS